MIYNKNYLLDLQLRAFELLSGFLNESPDAIKPHLVKQLCNEIGCSEKYAVTLLLAAYCGLDTTKKPFDRDMFKIIFEPAMHHLDVREYQENSYYRNIAFPQKKVGTWEFCTKTYKPFECFVYNDILTTSQGVQIPQIGFFGEAFSYPAVLENDRIWMTITPNEIETMKEPLQQAKNKVVTFGLGLGYFVYMAAKKSEVSSVTVVERDQSVIQLFEENILPQIPDRQKVRIVKTDAFEYAEKVMPQENYDFAFTDLWHDVSDGIPLYLKMKDLERFSPQTQFTYWIEKSILCYDF